VVNDVVDGKFKGSRLQLIRVVDDYHLTLVWIIRNKFWHASQLDVKVSYFIKA